MVLILPASRGYCEMMAVSYGIWRKVVRATLLTEAHLSGIATTEWIPLHADTFHLLCIVTAYYVTLGDLAHSMCFSFLIYKMGNSTL